jgi:carboxymethylenebutenolidase
MSGTKSSESILMLNQTPLRRTTATLDACAGAADAYFVTPAADSPHPAVLLYTDILGLRPAMQGAADRIAAAGYAVLVPNVFYRRGPAPVVHMPAVVTDDNLWGFVGGAAQAAQELPQADAMCDAKCWLDWLESNTLTFGGPIGIVGYCNGGMLCLRTAGTYPDRVAAAAIVHGSHLITDAPDSPHLVVGSIQAEVLLADGDADTVNPPETVEQLREALSDAGATYRSETYPGAQHAFTAPDLAPLYDHAATEAHWREVLDLFGRTLRIER